MPLRAFQGVGVKSARCSSMARAWNPCATLPLKSASAKRNRSRRLSSVASYTGIPSEPTVSQTPIAAHDTGDDAGAEGSAEQFDDGVIRIADAVQVFGDLHGIAICIHRHALALTGEGERFDGVVAGEVVVQLEDIGAFQHAVLVAVDLDAVPGAVGEERDCF